MNFQKDSRPELRGATVIGYFAITEIEDNKQILLLYDELRNSYSMDKVSVITTNYSTDNADVDIPDPYIISKNGEILKTGAKVLIDFPFDRQNAIVTGCIMPLGQQDDVRQEIRANRGNMQRKVSFRSVGNTKYTYSFDEGGIIQSISKGSFSFNSDNAITLIAEKFAQIIGKERLEALAQNVEIGGNHSKVESSIDNKADIVNVLTKKFVVGHSDERIAEIIPDPINDDALNDPRLQAMLMGSATARLLEIFIDELFDAIYLGAGSPVRMSETSKAKIRLNVKQKIPQIISEVGFILKAADILKDRNANS